MDSRRSPATTARSGLRSAGLRRSSVEARQARSHTVEHEIAAGAHRDTAAPSHQDLHVVMPRLEARQIDANASRLDRHDAGNGPRAVAGLRLTPSDGDRPVEIVCKVQEHADASHLADRLMS